MSGIASDSADNPSEACGEVCGVGLCKWPRDGIAKPEKPARRHPVNQILRDETLIFKRIAALGDFISEQTRNLHGALK